MIGWLRHLFRHRHRPVKWASVMAPSKASGVPVKVMQGAVCKCGEVVEDRYTDAGYQQMGWGVDSRPWIDELRQKLGVA